MVTWNDQSKIEAKVRKYYQRNLLVANEVVYYRIETPVVGRAESHYGRDILRRVFTPFGGFGDPILNYEKAWAAANEIAKSREWHPNSYFPRPEPFFRPIDGYGLDPLLRQVRACFIEMFNRSGWLASQRMERRKSPRLPAFGKLHDLWLENYDNLTDEVLDEATELMLPFAGKGPIAGLLHAWTDRPIQLAI